MERIILADNKGENIIQRFKQKYPYSYNGRIKELMENDIGEMKEEKKTKKVKLPDF